MNPRLSVTIGSLRLKNPVMVASGTFGYGKEFADFLDLKRLGAIVTKTITIRPRQGNPPPRTCETPAGMLNSIGLENPGIDAFFTEKLPFLKKTGVPLIASIASEGDSDEFVALARRLEKVREIAAIELNISCPNIAHSHTPIVSGKRLRTTDYGLIAQDPKATYAVVTRVRRVTKKTLITKLSPNVTSIVDIAAASKGAGSDAVSLINTVNAMSIDVRSRTSKIAMGNAGLSGPAVRPIALRMVWEVFTQIKIPVIGMGGISDSTSALEFIIAGARAVSVGTANFINPGVTVEIIEGIARYLRDNNLRSVKALTGSLRW